MSEPTPDDLKLLLTAGRVAIQVQEQLGAQGASVEEVWIVLALAARTSERAVIEADRHFQDLHSYAEALTHLAHLQAISDAASERVEELLAREDGAPDVIRS